MKKICLSSLVAGLVLSAIFICAFFIFNSANRANAQMSQFYGQNPNYLASLAAAVALEAEEETNVEEQINLDEDFQPEDFGLEDVGMLPTNPFYFLKNIRRGVSTFFTFDPAEKAEKKIQFAAEKLLEADALIDMEDFDKEDVHDALGNFKEELQRIEDRTDVAIERADEEGAEDLAEKMMDNVIKYEKSLGKFEKMLPPESFEHVDDIKDKTSETFGKVFDLMEPEEVSEKLVEILEEQEGSDFKDFKNVEVLKEIKEKAPEDGKVAVEHAQETTLNKLHGELEKFEEAKKAIFEDFVKEIGGSEVRHLEIINEMEIRPISDDLREAIVKAKEKTLVRTEERLKVLDEEQKKQFLAHLEEGSLENLRIMKEIEANISKQVAEGIQEVKKSLEADFQKRLAEIETNQQRKTEFFKDVERFHDVKAMSVMDEIEALIPEDKIDFFKTLKKKMAQEIKADMDSAQNDNQKTMIVKALASDQPKDFEVIDKYETQEEYFFDMGRAFFEGIRQAQMERMQDRVEVMDNQDRFVMYEDEFKTYMTASSELVDFDTIFIQKREVFESPDRAQRMIEEARKVVAELRVLVNDLPVGEGYTDGQFDWAIKESNMALVTAQKKLANAEKALAEGKSGEAFGEANAAMQIAGNGIRMANDYKYGMKKEREVVCPFFMAPPSDFCRGGIIINEVDEFGCMMPPRCEFKRCPMLSAEPCPDGYYREKIMGDEGCPIFGQCIEMDWDYDMTPCPMMMPPPCPPGEYRKEMRDENGCPVFGECVAEVAPPFPPQDCMAWFEGYVYDPMNRDCRKESTSGCHDPFIYHTVEECSRANGLIQKWKTMVWTFKDGSTIESKILDRTDSEYLNYITQIKEQCSKINTSQFFWMHDAGNSADWNWRNFGIPNCTGDDGPQAEYCGPNVCATGDYCADSARGWCCPNGMMICPDGKCVKSMAECGTVQPPSGWCGDGMCNNSETPNWCPMDCGGVIVDCYDILSETTCINTPSCSVWCEGESPSGRDCFGPGHICGEWTPLPPPSEKEDCLNQNGTWCTNNCNEEFCLWGGGICPAPDECSSVGYDRANCELDGGIWCPDDMGGGWCNYSDSYCPAQTGCQCSWGWSSSCSCGAGGMTCNNNGVCENDENMESCPNDCAGGSSTGYCGDGICQETEYCPTDCSGGSVGGCDNIYDEFTCMNTTGCGVFCPGESRPCYGSGHVCGGISCQPETCYDDIYCYDGIDNDNDGYLDMADPGCGGMSGCTNWVSLGSVCDPSVGTCCSDSYCNNMSGPGICEYDMDCDYDGWCEPEYGETQGNCPEDCTEPTSVCGDGMCNNGETCSSCSTDCGECGPVCGNGFCESGEDSYSCSSDCGAPPATSCPATGYNEASTPNCSMSTCPDGCILDADGCPVGCFDTQSTQEQCGDGTCGSTETPSSCPADCVTAGYCGDGTCQSSETCSDCSTDCGECGCECSCGWSETCDCATLCPVGGCNEWYNYNDCTSNNCVWCDNSYSCYNVGHTCSCDYDGVCESGEETCTDCMSTGTDCDYDGWCDSNETAASCPDDCDIGGGMGCGSYTDESSCYADPDCGVWCAGESPEGYDCYGPGHICGGTTSYCGDAMCDSNETCSDCSIDCGDCGPVCGDGVCDSGEDSYSCETDCGAPAMTCYDLGGYCCVSDDTCSSGSWDYNATDCPSMCCIGTCEPMSSGCECSCGWSDTCDCFSLCPDNGGGGMGCGSYTDSASCYADSDCGVWCAGESPDGYDCFSPGHVCGEW